MSDTLNLANSIWPNGMKVDSDGHAVFYPLGTNKVNVPTSSTQWPKGNKLVSPYVYQDDKLVGFVDTKALTVSGNTTIYLPYEHIEAEFSAIDKGQLQIHAPNAITKKASWKDSEVEDIPEAQYKYKGCKTVDNVKTVDNNYKTTDIVNGTWSEPLWDLEDSSSMFYGCTALTSFNSDLSSLTNGESMFKNCANLTAFTNDLSSLTNGISMFTETNLTTFSSDLNSLITGEDMFAYCLNLTSFDSDLSSLTYGFDMFRNCTNLTTFTPDVSSLSKGNYMFAYCLNLTSFDSDLSSLTDGSGMFYNCTALTTFTSDLSSLYDGDSMFYNCTALTTFTSNLRYLIYGRYMFYGCKLDTPSVQNIADTIKTVSSGTIHIGIGNSTPNEQETEAFNTIASKGWTVYVNGLTSSNVWNPTSLTPENGEETTTPIPFWAKPVPATEETASYTDSEGNFYNILGAQFVYGDDLSTYGMFTSEEDAAANMRLTPYIKPQTEIENQ